MILPFEKTQQPAPASLHSMPMAPADLALVELGKHLQQLNYRFTTPTPATIARVNARAGNERAHRLADVFGWNRPFDPALLPPAMLALMREADVLEERAALCRSSVRVASVGDQLCFHSAFPTDAADAVFFGPDTYRFVRQLQAEVPALAGRTMRAADIGCGAGPGALLLARLCPAATVHALDINPLALRLTGVNARLAGLDNVLPGHSDMLDGVDGSFDLLVSNPPYLVDPAKRAYRHGGGALGAGLSLAVVDAAIARLAVGGALLMYTGAAIVGGEDPLRAAAALRLADAGFTWSYDEIDPDVFGEELATPAYCEVERIAAVWLRAVKPGVPKVYW